LVFGFLYGGSPDESERGGRVVSLKRKLGFFYSLAQLRKVLLAQGLGTGVKQAFGLFDGVGGSFLVNTFGHGFFTDQNVAVKVFLSFRAENGKKAR